MRSSKSAVWTGIGATIAMLLFAAPSVAATVLTLHQEPAQTVGPQSSSNPCVIAATQCQQPAGMDFTDYTQKGSVSAYNEVSPTYTVGELEGFVGSIFNVAIDVNTTVEEGETLQLFEVLINGVQQFVYTGPTVIGGVSSNGNGYGDWTLRTVDLSQFADGASVVFHAIWNNASDGGESFFLVPVPGPIVGAGLPGLILACGGLIALARRRREQLA